MGYSELRDLLFQPKDTPSFRSEVLCLVGDDDFMMGYAEVHFPGILEWMRQQAEIEESLVAHADNSARSRFKLKSLRGADLRGATLIMAELAHADLRGADLTEANLDMADLTEADLQGANLKGAFLGEAEMYGANLCGACLKDTSWTSPDFRNAIYDENTIFPVGLNPEAQGMIKSSALERGSRTENPPRPVEASVVSQTSRCSPAIGANAITPRYVIEREKTDQKVLDYGAGHCAMQTIQLKGRGFRDVTAWEVEENRQTEHHNARALSRKYDVVMASNVMNVQLDPGMLRRTLREIASVLKKGGRLYANYPKSPRKVGLSDSSLVAEVQRFFEVEILRSPSKGLVFVGVKA